MSNIKIMCKDGVFTIGKDHRGKINIDLYSKDSLTSMQIDEEDGSYIVGAINTVLGRENSLEPKEKVKTP